MYQSKPIENVKTGDTIRVVDFEVPGFEGKFHASNRVHAYLVEDIEPLHHGQEFRVTYGDETGWTDTTSFVAGELVEVA